MKKNAMLKIAAILMVAVLLTTCAISSTFAKYVTSGGVAATDARVAKWGVTVAATNTTNKLFGLQYGDNDSTWVATSGTDEVVAPGTKGSAPTFTVSGSTEVAVEIKATANVELENWYLDALETNPSDVYCPLAVKVGTGTTPLTINDGEDFDDFEARIEAAIVKAIIGNDATIDTSTTPGTSSSTKSVAPNTPLTTATVDVSWEWAFSATDADEKDTALGTNALTSGKAATISVAYSVSVEQVNTEAPSAVKA